MEGRVRALFIAPEKKAKPVMLDEVCAIAAGFEGDFHTTTTANRRQILMISQDVLQEFDLPPGSLFENIVVEGLDVMKFESGRQLRVGGTILEVTVPCTPCGQMEGIRQGLKRALDGRRGMFARVVSSGIVRVGDVIHD